MINFFKKQKKQKPWIRFFSLEQGLPEIYPIKLRSSIKQPWQENKEKSKCPITNKRNSAKCPAIKQISKIGWVVQAPMDFAIYTNGDGSSFEWTAANNFKSQSKDYITFHDIDQTAKILDRPNDTLKRIIKVDTPWRITASEDIVLLQQHIHWNNENRFTAVTGVIDPQFTLQVNVQLQWHILNSGKEGILIEAGTPLAQFIPIPRIYLEKNWYDISIENANSKDWDLEKAVDYAMSAKYVDKDDVYGRIHRVKKAIKYYKTKK